MNKAVRQAAYLSGAPRITTSDDAENTAARNHVLEVIRCFEELNISMDRYILGNLLPKKFTGQGSEGIASKSILNRIATDIFRLLLCFQNQFKAKKAIKSEGLGFVYERFALMQMVGWTFKKRGIPWLLETNAILSEEAFYESKTMYLKPISEWLEKVAYQRADILICISEDLKNAIVDKYEITPDKIYVMQNGVNIDRFKFEALPTKQEPEEFIIGYVGSLATWQSLDLLIEALNDLKNEIPNLKIRIVGDGPDMSKLKNLAEKLDLTDRIDFVGRVSPNEIPHYIKTFSVGYCNPIHVSSSTSEVFNSPMKLYEYLAMGKPVLAKSNYDVSNMKNSSSYISELKSDGVKSIKNGIRHFYSKKDHLQDIGKLASEEIINRHSWNGRVKDLLIFAEKKLNISII